MRKIAPAEGMHMGWIWLVLGIVIFVIGVSASFATPDAPPIGDSETALGDAVDAALAEDHRSRRAAARRSIRRSTAWPIAIAGGAIAIAGLVAVVLGDDYAAATVWGFLGFGALCLIVAIITALRVARRFK